MDGVSNLAIETIRVLVNHRFGQYLAELKRVLFEGSSENRQRILDFVLGEHIYLIMDESFVPALAKCASDESRDVRYHAPFVIGARLDWLIAAEQRELNRRDEANSIALLMKLSKDNDALVRRGAATFLRGVPEKNDDVFERLVEFAITEREPDRLGAFGLRDEKERVRAWLYRIISKPKSKELQTAALQAHEELFGRKTTIDEARKKAEQFDNREFNNTDSDAANSDTSINNVSPASNDPVVLTAFGETISLTGLLPVDAHLKHKQLSPDEYEEWLIQARGITAYDRIWHAVRQQFINTKKLHHTSTELASIDAYLNHHAATNWKHLSDIEREKRIADAVTIARLTHMNWKVCKALHAQHGGRVGTNQTGAWIAFDAQNKLLKQHIDTGAITIHDSEVEAAFWSHTRNERFADAIPTGSQLQELLSIPPYVRSSSVNLPSE